MNRLLIVLCFISLQAAAYTDTLLLMGSRFEITAIDPNPEKEVKAVKAAIEEIQRIERLISSWDPNSQTSEINRMAGLSAVAVAPELFDLIQRAIRVSELTNGSFDISFQSAHRWKFDGSSQKFPSKESIQSKLELINYKNIICNTEKQTVFLKNKGMRIGFGAIGKGYAADKAKALMSAMNIQSGMVNAGGDLTAWGKNSKAKQWKIGISHPEKKQDIISWLAIDEQAVVTSGDYEKYLMVAGKRYAHIIDPKTAYPVSGIRSATVICPSAELADALATSIFVLGVDKGLALIDKLADIECFIVSDDFQMHYSKGMQTNFYQNTNNR